MNDQPVTSDEQDDAAFRARLAPLASEVLPTPPRAEPRAPGPRRTTMSRARLTPEASLSALPAEPLSLGSRSLGRRSPGRRRPAIALAAIGATIAAAIVGGIAWLQFKWPWSQPPSPAHVAVWTDPAMRPPAPTKPATGDSDRAAERTDAVPSPAMSAQMLPEAAAMVGLLVRRGDAALADGDIIGARLLFERAAALGSAAAATAAGKTYDIEFLLQAGARGIRADQAAATAWFRKAAALGDPEARALLARIEARSRQ